MKRAQAKEIPPISARGLQVRALCLFGAFQVTDKG
jgi:hypothetical protein